MRWWKRFGEPSDLPEHEERLAAYSDHLAAIEPSLSPALLALSRVSLHDGLIRRLTVNETKGTVTLGLVIGDLQRGYSHARIKYRGASLVSSGADLRWLVEYEETELLDDEIDVQGDRFVHRMLFWPAGELHVEFSSIDLSTRAVADRSRKRPQLRWIPPADETGTEERQITPRDPSPKPSR